MYTPQGKKSSANAAKCDALEGVHAHQVGLGDHHTLCRVLV